MAFEKGKSGNPQGRPKGKVKFSTEIRDQITDYCKENLMYFLNEIKKMRPGMAKSQAFLTLLQYTTPKLTESNSVIDIDSLNDEQIDKLLTRKINEDNDTTGNTEPTNRG